jgi:uncharacterized protein (TIGR03085 family)
MTPLARTERSALCDDALRAGEGAPTLCAGWTVKDLVVHLVVREGSPASVGIAVPPLSGLTERAYERARRRPFESLVEQVRNGPPRLSPYALPKVDELANGIEMFVHHEDIRRAQPGWEPRQLDAATDERLWSAVSGFGRRLVRKAPVGVTAERTPGAKVAVLKDAAPSVTVSGPPGEVLLYLLGRREQARVTLRGSEAALARLADAPLGI